MSALLPDRLQHLLLVNGAESQGLLLGVLAILLLVILLVLRELLRAAGDQPVDGARQPAQKGKLLDVVIIPLVFIFAFVVLEHFYRLIF